MMEPMTPDAGGAPLPSSAYGRCFHAAPVADDIALSAARD